MVAGLEDKDKLLGGRQIAFTGRLASMTREEAAQWVRVRGGEYITSPGPRTDCLVVGQEGWPLQADGRVTRKLARAHELRAAGSHIAIVPEDDFLEELGLNERRADIQRLYTVVQLTRILGVRRDRIRRWVRAGFLRPSKTVHRLEYFDFRQVAGARTLWQLIHSGVTLDRLRRSFQNLRRWLPGIDQPLAQLSLLGAGGRLLVRLDGGQLADSTGQLYFPFMACGDRDSEPPAAAQPNALSVVMARQPRSSHDWFERGLQCEDSGCPRDAEVAYRTALQLSGPQPELCFNLGNVLYAQGRKAQAAERFMQAVELDQDYVEAWNNLGNAFVDMLRWDDAIRAYRRAIEIEPLYADAHYNLAEALCSVARVDEARSHWRAYLQQDPRSAWAVQVRRRMRETEPTG